MGRNYSVRIKTKLPVSIQPNIGLGGDERDSIMEILNINLADEALLTMKTRSAHWHVRGPGFLELRTLFDQQVRQLNKILDEIAERVRILGGYSISSFEEFLSYTRLQEQPGEGPEVINLLADHEALIRFLREDARKCLEVYEDHGTNATFVSFISAHEKMAWILRSKIESGTPSGESQDNKAA